VITIGRPSGIATIIKITVRVIASMSLDTNCFQSNSLLTPFWIESMIMEAPRIIRADQMPINVKLLAKTLSFFCKSDDSVRFNSSGSLLEQVSELPTHTTTTLAVPTRTWLSANRKGSTS